MHGRPAVRAVADHLDLPGYRGGEPRDGETARAAVDAPGAQDQGAQLRARCRQHKLLVLHPPACQVERYERRGLVDGAPAGVTVDPDAGGIEKGTRFERLARGGEEGVDRGAITRDGGARILRGAMNKYVTAPDDGEETVGGREIAEHRHDLLARQGPCLSPSSAPARTHGVRRAGTPPRPLRRCTPSHPSRRHSSQSLPGPSILTALLGRAHEPRGVLPSAAMHTESPVSGPCWLSARPGERPDGGAAHVDLRRRLRERQYARLVVERRGTDSVAGRGLPDERSRPARSAPLCQPRLRLLRHHRPGLAGFSRNVLQRPAPGGDHRRQRTGRASSTARSCSSSGPSTRRRPACELDFGNGLCTAPMAGTSCAPDPAAPATDGGVRRPGGRDAASRRSPEPCCPYTPAVASVCRPVLSSRWRGGWSST